MEVRSGYKQTEIGVIPKDWNILTLENVALNGCLVRGPFGGSLKKEFFTQRGYKVYEQRNAIYETLEKGDYFVDLNKFRELERFWVRPGDFIVSCSGTIGCIYRIPNKAPEGLINQALLKITLNNEKVNAKFFLAVFRSESFQKRIKENSHGGAMQNLVGMDTFRKTLFQSPSTLAEQESIAEALSDADALIESLEQLIVKKRQIKQAVMQKLLSPKEEWKEVTLFELANSKKEFFDDGDWIEAEHITDDGVRLIQTGNIGIGQFIEKETKKFIFEKSFVALSCKETREGDLLICRLAEPAGRACILPNIDESKIVTSVDITIFRPLEFAANRVFLVNLFSTDQWFRAVNDRSGGTTHKRISRGSLGRMRIKIPTLDEQAVIATVLSDIDVDISVLEAKLEKIRKIKQGMMHNLLSGRIRLI